METIKINDIVKKTAKNGKPFWVIRYYPELYDKSVGCIETDATIGYWDIQLADYIEKDVGIGGTVSVLIEQKGEYTNITKVDMKSAVKGENPEWGGRGEPLLPTEMSMKRAFVAGEMQGEKSKPTSDREKTIIAQCLTKVYCRNMVMDCDSPKYVLDAYNYFLSEL